MAALGMSILYITSLSPLPEYPHTPLIIPPSLRLAHISMHLQHHEAVTIDGTHFEINRWHDGDHFYKRISVSDAALEGPLEVTEKITKFSLGDFTDMLSYQNMQVTEVFGNYQLQPYDVRKTPRMIVLAKKKYSIESLGKFENVTRS